MRSSRRVVIAASLVGVLIVVSIGYLLIENSRLRELNSAFGSRASQLIDENTRLAGDARRYRQAMKLLPGGSAHFVVAESWETTQHVEWIKERGASECFDCHQESECSDCHTRDQ